MTNQFFIYTRKEPLPVQIEGQELKFKEFKDAFSIDKVIRLITIEDDQVLVLLNDIHVRSQEIPIYNKRKELTGYKKENITVQSEIYLSSQDSERFYELISLK